MSLCLEDLPVEILVLIIKAIDNAKSVESIRRVSDRFADIVHSAERDGALWQRICKKEIPHDHLMELILNMYPHTRNVEAQINKPCQDQRVVGSVIWYWVHAYWWMHDKILSQQSSETSVRMEPLDMVTIKDLCTHSDIVIFACDKKVDNATIRDIGVIGIGYSQILARNVSDTGPYYIAPCETTDTDGILIPCGYRKCLAKPLGSMKSDKFQAFREARQRREYEYPPPRLLYNDRLFPSHISSWFYASWPKRVKIITRDDCKIDLRYRKMDIKVQSVKTYCRFILIGTVSGTLYVYNINKLTPTKEKKRDGKIVFSQYELTEDNLTWKRNTEDHAPITCIDVSELPNVFIIVCASKNTASRFFFNKMGLVGCRKEHL